jgi:hypothetical protein
MGESDKRLREKGMRREMKAKKLVKASERLEELTSEQLAEVNGGGMPFYGVPFYGSYGSYRSYQPYRPYGCYGFRHHTPYFPYI